MDVLCADRLMGSRPACWAWRWDHPVAVIVEKLPAAIMMKYCRLTDWGLRCALLALPSAVALGILAKPLTVSLFRYGKFTAFDAAMTQRALSRAPIRCGADWPIVVKCWPRASILAGILNAGENRHRDTLIMTQLMNTAFVDR